MHWAYLVFALDLFLLIWFGKLVVQGWPRTPEGKPKIGWLEKIVITWNLVFIPAFIYLVLTGAYD